MLRASCYGSTAKPSVELSGPSVEPTEDATETHSERVTELFPCQGTFPNTGARRRCVAGVLPDQVGVIRWRYQAPHFPALAVIELQ
jgi:hypothetical protein